MKPRKSSPAPPRKSSPAPPRKRTKSPMNLKGKVKGISPNSKRGSRHRLVSPSPMRIVGVKTVNNTLYKEITLFKMQEANMQKKLNIKQQEHNSLKETLFKIENNIKLKAAKVENEREKAFLALEKYIKSKKICLDLPSNYDVSQKEDFSQQFKSSRNSVSRKEGVLEDIEHTRMNNEIKQQLIRNETHIDSSLRAILRAHQLNTE